ncbi:MAG: gamma-glutamyl-gamma-aminobutyrate hydrolase family protein [Solirubrobacteraceae bacterium]|nr:gamma-glutamyl-gamma-aminobutyrate hydrolase family protein [Solirubrobacteraceae bacterium]
MDARDDEMPGLRRPVIGIAAAREVVSFSWWTIRSDFMTSGYSEAIQRAGGRAVLLALDPLDALHPHEVIATLDGLILPGGADMDPAHYGHEPHRALGPTDADLDAVQLALARAAIEADLPLLGICRGMQVMNVAAGGTLHQHLPDLLEGSEEHRRVPGTLDEHNAHPVDVEPGSLAALAAGAEPSTRSHHHQAVDEVGDGFIVTGRHTGDGLIEAIEAPRASYCLGVQWHPEADPESPVIASLVAAARARMQQPSS